MVVKGLGRSASIDAVGGGAGSGCSRVLKKVF